MTLWAKEKILWIMLVITIILDMDVWAWDKIYPILFGIFPYHFWYVGLLFGLLIVIYGWWSFYQWEDYTDEIAEFSKNQQQKTGRGGDN